MKIDDGNSGNNTANIDNLMHMHTHTLTHTETNATVKCKRPSNIKLT